MDGQRLNYYVYYSHQKIMQLYRQLPESRLIAQKTSVNCNSHADVGLHPADKDFHKGPPGPGALTPSGPCEPFLRMGHMGTSGSRSHYNESLYDKNEMYRLERVLRCLRKSGQLRRAGAHTQPGQYFELQAHFSPLGSPAPAEDMLWLHAPAKGRSPALRLLCHARTFCGECEELACGEVWACGATLPLQGVAICFGGSADLLYGLPLMLALAELPRE